MLLTKDGYIQGWNAQAAVDGTAQVIVAHGLTHSMSDHGQLVDLIDGIEANLGRKPQEASADAGYLSEANLAALDARGIKAYIATGRAKHPDEVFKVIQYLITPEIFSKYYAGQWPAQKSLMAKIQRDPSHAGYPEQLKHARQWGPYSTGPVAIPTMWNAVGRAAGAVFTGEKTSKAAAKDIHDLVQAELAKVK